MALTLELNKNWDIFADEDGNIAIAKGAYAIAQNVANAVRLFTNDAYFNKDKGIPHFNIELGGKPLPNRSTLTNRIRNAALAVEGVQDVEITLEFNEATRVYGGEIYITTADSSTVRVEI